MSEEKGTRKIGWAERLLEEVLILLLCLALSPLLLSLGAMRPDSGLSQY